MPWNAITSIINFSVMTSPNRDGAIDATVHGITPAETKALVGAAHAHRRKVLLGIGGSDDLTWDAACSDANRTTFISNLVGLMRQYDYDGIDLDIEQDWGYPQHADYIACVAWTES